MNWTEENSRVVQEYLNESKRETPLEVVTPENRADYDVEMAGTGNREEGQRFSSSATSSEVAEWLTEIGY